MLKITPTVVSANSVLKPVNSEWARRAGVDRDVRPTPQKFINLTQDGTVPEADAETFHEFLKDMLFF